MISRRVVLGSGAALSAALAGCTGGGSDGGGSETDADTDAATDAGTGTETETATKTTEKPGPTLAEFEYPDGAARDGIDGGTLFGTHESTVTDAGTLTVESEITREFSEFADTESATNEIGEGGVARTTDDGDLTESLWSPDGEAAAYVRMKSGFEERYRIDDRAPRPRELAELGRFEALLRGAAWSEALEVVEAGEGYAATYESTGVADEDALLGLAFGDSVAAFEARVAVSQSGYVREVVYNISVAREGDDVRHDATLAVGGVGETTVAEPDWADAAREEGVRFAVQPTSDGRGVELEMVNGGDVPAESRLALSDARGRGQRQLSEPLSAGDRLFVGLSDGGELLKATDGVPDGARALEGFARTTIRYRGYLLLQSEGRL
ncbi:DUF7537 family lipoprotein [Halostella litorea]|uniref:DUF7537 family lipoprotein n=1 Tax=Halostella litorea TaxID=2528831 RepID=UPI0010931705|nr:hypothetical protein [Halostella litorea]